MDHLRVLGRAEHEQPGRLGKPQRPRVQLRHLVTEESPERASVVAALGRPDHLDIVGAHPVRQHHDAVQQHVEALGWLALGEARRAGARGQPRPAAPRVISWRGEPTTTEQPDGRDGHDDLR
jgi:hypothetical protein